MAVGAARSSASPASRSQRWCSATPIRTATHAAAWSAAPAPLPHCRCLGRSAAHTLPGLARARALSPAATAREPRCRWHAARVQHSAAAPGAAATVHGTGPVQHKQHVATRYTVFNAAQDVARRCGVLWRRRHSARTCAAPPMRRRFRSVKNPMQPTALFVKHKHTNAQPHEDAMRRCPTAEAARACAQKACACAHGWVGGRVGGWMGGRVGSSACVCMGAGA